MRNGLHKLKYLIIFYLLAGILFNGCSPKLTRRFKPRPFEGGFIPFAKGDAWEQIPSNQPYIRLSAFTMDTPPSNALLLALSPEGQAAYIKALADKTGKDQTGFAQILAGSGGTKSAAPDKTVFNKRIAFSVRKNSELYPLNPKFPYQLADRLHELTVTLDLPSSDAIFASWNRFETKTDTVDLGKITRTQTTEGELTGTFGFGEPTGSTPPFPFGITARGKRALSLEEALSYKKRYVTLSGTLKPNQGILYQEGAPGIDLIGTFFVDVTIRIKGDSDNIGREYICIIEKLGTPQVTSTNPSSSSTNKNKSMPSSVSTQSSSSTKKSDQSIINFVQYRYYKGGPIFCNLTYDYILRHVVSGTSQIAEGLQKARYWVGQGSEPIKVELISKFDVPKFLYVIKSSSGILGCDDNDIGKIKFLDFKSAQDFLRWLKTYKATKINEYNLTIANKLLEEYTEKQEEYDSLHIEQVELLEKK